MTKSRDDNQDPNKKEELEENWDLEEEGENVQANPMKEKLDLEEDEDWDLEEDKNAQVNPLKEKLDLEEEEDWDLEEGAEAKINKLSLDDEDDIEEKSDEEEKSQTIKAGKSVDVYTGIEKTFLNSNFAKQGVLASMGPETLLVAAYFTGKQEIVDQAIKILTELRNTNVISKEAFEGMYQKTFERAIIPLEEKPFDGKIIKYDKSKYDITADLYLNLAEKTNNRENIDTMKQLLSKVGYEIIPHEEKKPVKASSHDASGTIISHKNQFDRVLSAIKFYGDTAAKKDTDEQVIKPSSIKNKG